MHRMQSGGWPYSEDGRDCSKAPSLRVAFLRTAVFRFMHESRARYIHAGKLVEGIVSIIHNTVLHLWQ